WGTAESTAPSSWPWLRQSSRPGPPFTQRSPLKTSEIMVVLVPGVTKPDRETGAMKATLPATWPKFDRVPLGPVVSLEAALSGHYDAEPFDPRGYHDGRCYLMQCAPMAVRAGHGPRLATDAWKHEGGVRMQLLLTDIDASDKRADDAWWAAQAPALEAFL